MANSNPDVSKLKPVRTKKEATKRGRAGGIASGKKRQEQKAIKEYIKIFLSQKTTDETIINKLTGMGIDKDLIDNKMALVLSLFKQSMKGNTRAIEDLINYSEGKPQESIKVTGDEDSPYKSLSDEELRKLANG